MGEKTATTLRTSKKLLDLADERAREEGLTRSHYIVTLIEKDTRRRRSRSDGPDRKPAEPNVDIFD